MILIGSMEVTTSLVKDRDKDKLIFSHNKRQRINCLHNDASSVKECNIYLFQEETVN